MFAEVALIVVSCVLFVQMGLSEAIQDTLSLRLRLVSCPKCLTMWACLAYLLVSGYGFILSVATSFLCSYAAMWLALLYDAAAVKYNAMYEQILSTPEADGTAGTETHTDGAPKAGDAELP